MDSTSSPRKKRRKKSNVRKGRSHSMPVINPLVAGIDLGSEQHWVCGPSAEAGEPNVQVFGTTTAQLENLAAWLLKQNVESVAMESTHVYWIPVYELLEASGINVLLVNARQLHHVPGRKTDMQDCQWLQKLHSCGLLRGSFRPAESICRLRAIQRQRDNLVEERSRVVNWMQKALDQMNVQVHRAVADITGVTGMAIVRAIVDGERDPVRLAALRNHRCKKSEAQIAEHLRGNWREEHLFNLECALRLFDTLESQIASYESRLLQEIEALQPTERKDQPIPKHPNPAKEKALRTRGEQEQRTQLWRFAGVDLTRVDGISTTAALIALTEVGTDLAAFPTEHNFVSWLRLSPRRPISGGKQLHKRPNGTGANRLSGALRMAALSLCRSKTALGAYYRKIARRKGGKVAVFATARKLAQLIYRMLRWGQDYVDIGEEAYERRYERQRLLALEQSARQFGYKLVEDACPTG